MKWKRLLKNEDGASAVIVALMLVVLLSSAALAVDLGAAYSKGAKIQNTCDAAALAAAHKLPNIDDTVATAKDYVKENGINPDNAFITINESGSTVEVNIKENVNTGFAKIIGVNALKINKHAIAGKMSNTTTTKKKIGAIFNYLLFQGSTNNMIFDSGGMSIYGQVHANGNIEINAALCALGGISESGNDLYATSSFPIVKRNAETNEFEEVGIAKIQWKPYKIRIEMYDGTVIEDITDSEYYIKEEKEIPMPDFITDNVDKLVPSQRPTVTDFFGWTTINGDLNSAPDTNIHYTGASATFSKNFSHSIYADNALVVKAQTADVNINGDIYCDGDLNLWAYGAKLNINGNIYVKGNLKFSTNGDISIKGNIYCDKDIISDGEALGNLNCEYIYSNNFIPAGRANISGVLVAENQITFTSASNSVDSSLAVVSKCGNIDLTAGSQEFNGIVYAPEGTATLGGVTTIHGNLIAKDLRLTSAISVYPLKDSTIDDLYDSILKDPTGESTNTTSEEVKLIE